jgi:hypothetical protein
MQTYLKRLFKVVGERRLWMTVLGKTGRQYIWLVRSSLTFNPDKPNLLIVGGFHGEEPAGPLAILKWLETVNSGYLKKANLTFLPVVNPIGFNRGTRYARKGQKTNGGFCFNVEGCPKYKSKDKLAVEGELLMENIDIILEAAKDGVISLHEDVDTDKFYIYDFGTAVRPGSFSKAIRDEESKFFEMIDNGVKVNEEGDPDSYAINGIVHNHHDGSFEDFLSHKGVKHSLTTETPGLNIGIDKRVDAGVALINKFINLSKVKK